MERWTPRFDVVIVGVDLQHPPASFTASLSNQNASGGPASPCSAVLHPAHFSRKMPAHIQACRIPGTQSGSPVVALSLIVRKFTRRIRWLTTQALDQRRLQLQ